MHGYIRTSANTRRQAGWDKAPLDDLLRHHALRDAAVGLRSRSPEDPHRSRAEDIGFLAGSKSGNALLLMIGSKRCGYCCRLVAAAAATATAAEALAF